MTLPFGNINADSVHVTNLQYKEFATGTHLNSLPIQTIA